MPLTDRTIINLKPQTKAYKQSDAQGLYLMINPGGSKLWNLKYRFAGKEKKLSLGAYPAVTLADARRLKDEARALLASVKRYFALNVFPAIGTYGIDKLKLLNLVKPVKAVERVGKIDVARQLQQLHVKGNITISPP